MELKFLGRGSAFNVKEGNTSAYIKLGDMLLLIDCGESVFQRILEKNLLDDIKEVNVLITHLHSDHCGSLSSLIMYCYFVKKIQPTILYPDKREITDYLDLSGCTDDMFNYVNPDGIEINSLNLGITMCPSKHVEEIKSYSYLLWLDEENKIYYSGDTSIVSDAVLRLLKRGHIIYHDTCLADYKGNVHTSLRKLCESVPKEHRSKVWCMHIDNIELIEKAKAEGFNVVEVE